MWLRHKLPPRGALVAAAALVMLLYMRPSVPPPLTDSSVLPADDGRWQQCRRVFGLTQVCFSWEPASRQRCNKQYWSLAELQRALHRRAEQVGRRAHVVFIGDSRVRIVQQMMAKRLQLEPRRHANISVYYTGDPLENEEQKNALKLPPFPHNCVEANIINKNLTAFLRCSLDDASERLHSEFWWRPYMDERFAELLDRLLDDCAAGRCPDLVVIDNGAWSAIIKRGRPGTERVVRFVAAITEMRERLARLGAATRVVWKLEEPYMPEPVWSRKSHITGMMMMMTTVVYEAAARLPSLTVWSAGIAEATRFYHSVCKPLRQHGPNLGGNPVREECLDPTHVGSTIRWSLGQFLLNALLLDVSRPIDGVCCGGPSV